KRMGLGRSRSARSSPLTQSKRTRFSVHIGPAFALGTSAAASRYIAMPDFPIDPEVRIRASPPIVLRRTTEAIDFIRKTTLSSPNRAWEEVLQSLEAARDEWTAMEAVVHLELLLEARNILIEELRPQASGFGQGQSRAA